MTHWGWYWKVKKKHIPKTLCSKLTAIDSFKLFKIDFYGFRIEPMGLKSMHKECLHNVILNIFQIRLLSFYL